MGAQKEMGLDSKLISLIDKDLRSEPLAIPSLTVAAAIDELFVSNHSSPTIISLYRSRLNKIKTRGLRDNSIVHLHWISGLIGHQQVKCLLDAGRKVVWTLHDMAPFTGVCHHSHGCSGFQGKCSACPQVRPMFRKAVELNLSSKALDGFEKNLVLVAPTPWVAKQARASSIFKNQRIEVIENPIRPEFFAAGSAESFDKNPRSKFRKQGEALVLTAVASDLTNPAKGVAELVRIFKEIRDGGALVRLQLVGGRGSSFHNPTIGIYWLGMADVSEMVQIARETHLLLSASTAESAGLVVREFGALSVPTLALRNGGIDDMIRDNFSGRLVTTLAEMRATLSAFSHDSRLLGAWGERASELSQQNRQDEVVLKYLNHYSNINDSQN